MKDFVLSLLSRGYGQIVPNEGGHDGRLEVCFEPEDYFNWKSQPPVLHLTSSGRFLGGVEPVPPKTYSTRRGPLILYSEDLALSYQSGQINRKGRAPGRSKQESAFKLHTLQDLTGAILAYGKKQSKVGFHPTHPLILDTKHDAQQIHRPAEKHYNTRQDKAEKGGQIRYQPHFLCSPRPNRPPLGPLPPITEGLVHLQSKEKSHMASDEQTAFTTNNQKDQQKRKERKRRSLGVVVDTCRAQMSPIPETESTQAELTDRTENQTILPVLTDHPKDLNGRGNCSLKQSVNGAGETCTLRSVYMDPTLECSPLSRVSYYGGYMEGSRQTGLPLVRQCGGETPVRKVNTETDPNISILHLPNINQSPLINSTLKTNKPEKDTNSCENSSQQQIHLPDIKVRATYENQPERAVHRKVLLLLPPPTEHTEKGQEPDDDLHVTLPCPVKDSESHGDVDLREALTQRGQDPLTDSRCRIIELDLGRDFCSDEMRDDRPPQGPLPPLVGRRGPGKQSSMAVYNQNQHEPADATDPQTGTIRGCLPLELREWQGGKSVGTLIMGPDGEIIRLSLWDPAVETEDHPMMGDVTQGHVLKVVTSEGDLKQPWTIFIQDSTTDEGKFTTHYTEATDSNEEHFDSSPKVLKGNIHAQQTNGKRTEERLDYDSITTEDSQMFVVKTNAKPSNEDIEKVRVGADNKIIKQGEVNTRAEKSIAKKKDSLGSDSKFIERAQVFRANLHEEQAAQMIKKYKSPVEEEEGVEEEEEEEDCLSSHNNTSKETQPTFPKVCLPEETSEELSSSTAHQPRRTGEEATGVQRTRKVKTTALQPEAGVTAGSRKSKGAAPLISPTSTNLTPTAHSPGESLSPQAKPELQTGLRMEAEKGHSMNTGGTEDADFTLLGKVKKNKKFNKQTGRSKERTGPSHKDVEAQNTRVPDGTSATPKLKKKKIKVEVEKEKEKPIKPQNPRENVKKKKKGQPAFVVGKPRPQDVEHIENQIIESQVDEHERPITQDRRTTPHNTEDDKLENSGAQEHTRVSSVSEDDMDADTHSMSSEMHEPVFSPRSAHSTQRSQHSLITALSEPSTHRLSQNSHRNASAGVATPCSSAPLSLIHLNQKSPHHSASDLAQTEPNNDAKSNEGPTNQTDRKAAALAERAERRRLEVERKRREREEEKKRQQEKEDREERMRMELEEEQRKRAEEARLQRLREEEERQRKEKEEMERQRREQVERERERKRQEEKRRLLERLQRERQEEERRQAADLERQRLEEEARQEEEDRKLSEMKEAERLEYLHRQQEEEEERRRAAEERRRREKEAVIHAEEEARLQAELFIRQREALEQHLKFHRGLFVEAGGLEQMQDVSRSWVFSYFTLLKLLGLTETSAHEDTLKDLL